MNCYVCDKGGRSVASVAICHHCGAALCREHLDADLLSKRSHGLARHGCTHDLVHSARDARDAAPSPAAELRAERSEAAR